MLFHGDGHAHTAEHPRACFFSFKADLKARHQMHKFVRYYQCNQLPGSKIIHHFAFSFHICFKWLLSRGCHPQAHNISYDYLTTLPCSLFEPLTGLGIIQVDMQLPMRSDFHSQPCHLRDPRFCDRCLAVQGVDCSRTLDYRDVGPTAAWELTKISDETYNRLDSESLSPWRVMPGFHFLTISHDFMHHVYLGTARDLCASGISTPELAQGIFLLCLLYV